MILVAQVAAGVLLALAIWTWPIWCAVIAIVGGFLFWLLVTVLDIQDNRARRRARDLKEMKENVRNAMARPED